jgi:hypothetical protein
MSTFLRRTPSLRPALPPPLLLRPQRNHLSGLKRQLLKLSFWNTQQLMEVRRSVAPAVARNKARAKTTQARRGGFSPEVF